MKKIGDVLAVIGIILVVYSFLGRFISEPTLGFGIIKVSANSGLTFANSLLLISILLKSWSK